MTPRARSKGRPSTSRRPAVPAQKSRTGAWLAALIVVAGLLAYLNALGHPLVFDDPSTIGGNASIRTVTGSIRGGPEQSATAGRPLVNLTFAINYALHGTAPWGYHAFNLGIHLLCALLVFALLRRMLAFPFAATWVGDSGSQLAGTVALLWVVHPLNSEIVNYATQRTEALMALAILTTLYCGVRALGDSRPGRWQVASVVACAAGMACKESMVTAPVMMLILESAFTRQSPIAVVRKRTAYYGALFATWIVLAALIVEGPRWRSAGFSSGMSPITYLLEQPRLIVRYLRLVLAPTGLVLDYGEPATRALGSVVVPGLAVLALLALTLVAWWLAPLLGLCGTWFFVTLAPTSSIVPIATEVGAERRMYLPLIALLLLLVLVVSRLIRHIGALSRTRWTGGLLAGASCLVFAGLTVSRNAEYREPLRLWRTVIERWPGSARGHYNYGIELVAAGRRAEGIDEYRRALPGSADAHYALGFELQSDGRYDEALDQYRAFIAQKPLDITVPRAYHQIGRTLMLQGRHADALAAFEDALARNPRDPGALGGRGDALLALERLPEAVTAYQGYLRAFPNSADGMMNLGLALVRLDRDAEARDLFAVVVQLKPDNVAAHVNLAYALANTGRYADSVREFRRAAELEKDPAARADIQAALNELLTMH